MTPPWGAWAQPVAALRRRRSPSLLGSALWPKAPGGSSPLPMWESWRRGALRSTCSTTCQAVASAGASMPTCLRRPAKIGQRRWRESALSRRCARHGCGVRGLYSGGGGSPVGGGLPTPWVEVAVDRRPTCGCAAANRLIAARRRRGVAGARESVHAGQWRRAPVAAPTASATSTSARPCSSKHLVAAGTVEPAVRPRTAGAAQCGVTPSATRGAARHGRNWALCRGAPWGRACGVREGPAP